MENWIQIDAQQINKEVTADIRGVNVKVACSPYDVPRQVRGYRQPNTNIFIIELQYLTDEETRSERPPPDCPFELEVGIHSNRIYKIKLDTEKMGCNAVRLEITTLARDVVGAIHKFRSTVPEKFHARFKMPEKAIFENRAQLFSEIAG